MAELLTHILVGYSIGMLLAFQYDWVRAPQVTLVMIGAASPDLNRVDLVIDSNMITSTFGIPWDWGALNVLGGNIMVLAILALLVTDEWRRRAFVLLVLGAISHHALDLLLLNASGYSYAVLWPVTEYQPPAGMLYRSSDRVPAVIAAAVAGAIHLGYRWHERTSPE